MADADLNRLIDFAKIRLPGVLDAALQMELFALLDEFFRTTNIWYQDIEFTVQPTDATYLENPEAFTYQIIPDQGQVTRLVGVVNVQGFLQAATMPIPGELILGTSPTETQTYIARVALTVTDPVTREGYPQFPDWIMTKYGSVFTDGLVGRMMSQVAKPYSSPQTAILHLKKFRSEMMKAKVEANHQNVYRGQNWSFPQTFARRRNQKF